MNNKLLDFISNSFLSTYIVDSNITDVSFNGESIFYQHNFLGRRKGDIQISKEEASDFVRQIANLSEKQFSYAEPVLDISIGKFRINAVHSSLCRVKDEKAISFSVRIGSYESKIKDDKDFMPKEIHEFLLKLIRRHESMVIAGATGTGKTELQKYLLSLIPSYTRVIIIDNIQELDNIRSNEDLDITTWQVSKNENGSFEALIKNALRSNPDWLVIAESRGKEMIYILNSVMTGHPIITTIHAKSSKMIPHRMVRMIQMGDKSQTYEELIGDIYEHIKYYIYLDKTVDEDGIIHRYIDEISAVENNELKLIYKKGEINYEDSINCRNSKRSSSRSVSVSSHK
ncbi:MAG: CpaF/VirB11 family protein [Bacilli bacterium]|nr:CpaF/VirB11 family protein [Bacilli bacterium]